MPAACCCTLWRPRQSEDDARQLTRQAQNLAASLQALPDCADLDTLRGTEGETARQHFIGLSLLVRPDAREHFHLNDGRSHDRHETGSTPALLPLQPLDERLPQRTRSGRTRPAKLASCTPGQAARRLALDLMEEFGPRPSDSR